jgi:hypothetical protein
MLAFLAGSKICIKNFNENFQSTKCPSSFWTAHMLHISGKTNENETKYRF